MSKATVHCEFARSKGYLNCFDCHLVISQRSACYHTSSERGEVGLSADLKILTIVYQIDILQAYLSIYFSCAGLMEVTSTFWVVTQPLPTAERTTIPNLKEEKQGFHMSPIAEIFIGEITLKSSD